MWLAYYVHHLNPFLIRFNDQFGIRWYGVAYLCGFVAAFYLLKWLARKGYGSLAETQVADFAFYGALFGVLLGGRLGYVIFYRPQMLTTDPLGILRVWDGGMASHGGILGLFIFTWIYARRHKISWTGIGDNLVAVAPLGLLFGRLANFINGELWGHPTNVPWAVQFPTELLDNADQAQVAIDQCSRLNPNLDSRLRFRKPDGLTTGCFFLLYPIMRIIGEIFRVPDAPLTGPFTRGQFLSLFMFLVALGFFWWVWKTRPKEMTNDK